MTEKEIEKLKNDRMYLVAIIREMGEELRAKGMIFATNRALFAPPDADQDILDQSPNLVDLLEGWAAEREEGKVPG